MAPVDRILDTFGLQRHSTTEPTPLTRDYAEILAKADERSRWCSTRPAWTEDLFLNVATALLGAHDYDVVPPDVAARCSTLLHGFLKHVSEPNSRWRADPVAVARFIVDLVVVEGSPSMHRSGASRRQHVTMRLADWLDRHPAAFFRFHSGLQDIALSLPSTQELTIPSCPVMSPGPVDLVHAAEIAKVSAQRYAMTGLAVVVPSATFLGFALGKDELFDPVTAKSASAALLLAAIASALFVKAWRAFRASSENWNRHVDLVERWEAARARNERQERFVDHMIRAAGMQPARRL